MRKRSRLSNKGIGTIGRYWAKRLKVVKDSVVDTVTGDKLTSSPNIKYLTKKREALIIDPHERFLYGLKRFSE